jgi:hypothetical protein
VPTAGDPVWQELDQGLVAAQHLTVAQRPVVLIPDPGW